VGQVPHAVVRGGDISLFAEQPIDDQARELHHQEHELEGATQQLLQQLRSVESAGDRSPILDQLSETVEKHFEVRQQIREKELEALEARVKKLRDLHEKREDAKADILRQRVDELVRVSEGLGWSGGEHAVFQPGHPQGLPTPPRAFNVRSRR
jgi:hypothetical protein